MVSTYLITEAAVSITAPNVIITDYSTVTRSESMYTIVLLSLYLLLLLQ